MPAPSRLRKRIARALMVSWREQPTRYDIEALQANIRRVGLVVRVRWALLVVLISYSVLAGLAYTIRVPASELAQLMAVPALALALVVVYNTFYSLNYRRLGNIALWNNVALALDAIVVTAAPDHMPQPLIDQLAPGGRLIAPVGSRFGIQQLQLLRKDAQGRAVTRSVLDVRFVPLTREPR